MKPSSLCFFESVDPHIVTPDTRVLSVALHAVCIVVAAGQKFRSGCTAEEMDSYIARTLAGHIMSIYNRGGVTAISDVVEVAKQHGLTLDPALDPEVAEVIQ